LFFAILAAAGVFNSKAPVPRVTTPPPRKTSTPTTATQPVAPPKAQAPSTTLKPGDTGSQVQILQRALAALGFSPGKADGDYGIATQIAVEKFQAAKQLGQDGIVGPETLAKLRQELAG
jgi:peptidoglycan hydrolase-like protein with peptidoglycan-binding domain